MSGHSKWHNIQAKKGKTDAARGKVFTKIGREIAVCVKAGGPDPNVNSKLKDIIAKAKQNNMPSDNIERSIKKASGELSGVNYEATTYEGYGVGGSAVIVECLTDNKNRTAGDVRHAFDKHGGSLGSTNCVSYLFKRKGVVVVTDFSDVDTLMLDAIEEGAVDVIEDEDAVEIITEPNQDGKMREALEKRGYNVVSSETALVPDLYVDLDKELKLASGYEGLKINDKNLVNLIITGQDLLLSFNKKTGFLERYSVSGTDFIKRGSALKPNFWRAPTDNDYGAQLQKKYAAWKNPDMSLVSLTNQIKDNLAYVKAEYDLKGVSAKLYLTYVINTEGMVKVNQKMIHKILNQRKTKVASSLKSMALFSSFFQ